MATHNDSLKIMRLRKLLFILLQTVCTVGAYGQLSGSITNKQGDPIPYANIYIEEQMHGTASDGSGRFSLHLNPGTYTVNFRAIGYKPQTQTINIGNRETKIAVVLEATAYDLKEIVISNKNNPANRIMRKAISNGQLYLSKLDGYNSNVYFKANVLFSKMASFIRWIAPKDSKLPISGKTYTMELVNMLTYKAPDSYTQKTISYRTNFPGDNFDIPGVDIYRSNIYNDQYYDTPSPMGRQAFSCYKFHLVATTVQDGTTIYKIGVAPKRSSGVFFKGFLYIKDNTYEITNAEMETTNGLIKIHLNISYDMVKQTVPLPTSISIKVGGSLMGITFSSNMVSSVKYNSVAVKKGTSQPSDKPIAAQSTAKQNKAKPTKLHAIEKKIEELSAKDNLTAKETRQIVKLVEKKQELEDPLKSMEEKSLKVEKDSLFNTQDTSYWSRIRPIPLSDEELKYSHETDSITARIPKGVAAPKDTTTSKARWKAKAIILGGSIYTRGNFSVASSGFIGKNASYFTPVDGYTIANKLTLKTVIDTNKQLTISVKPIYSTVRQMLMGEMATRFDFAPRHMGFIELSAKTATADFNIEQPINQMLNTLACLYFKKSYKKVMDTKEVNAKLQLEVANGLSVGLGARFDNRTLVQNNINHSLFTSNSNFESNTPENIYLDSYPLSNYNQTTMLLNISYTPMPRYRFDRNGYKRYTSLYWPTVNLKIEKGLNVWGSTSSFTNVELGTTQAVEIDMFNHIYYKAKAGKFAKAKGMQLSNFYFPNTAYSTIELESTKNSFTLLPYYRFATPTEYAEAHVCYEAQSILLKHLPFLSKNQFTENIMVGYYTTGRYRNYTEIAYGLDKLFFVGGVSAVASFENGKYSGWGIRVYLNLSSGSGIQIR